MALLANYSQLLRNTGRKLGNAFTAPCMNAARGVRYVDIRLADVGVDLDLSSQPDGYGANAWELPFVAGAMAAHGTMDGAGSMSAAVAGGMAIASNMAGSGDLTAQLGALAGMVAALTGSGSLSGSMSGLSDAEVTMAGSSAMTAAMGLLAGALAVMSGSGDLTASATGGASLEVSMAGASSLGALLTAVTEMVATMGGSGGMTPSVSAIGHMEASFSSAVAEDPLSPSALARAVWNAVAAEFNSAGTMGEVLNAAGGGSSPSQVAAAVWAALRATNQDTGSMGEALLELFELMGLDPTKPLVVTPTSRDAGAAIAQTIATVGSTTTVTRDP